jgi:hypothetical protein
LPILFTIPGPSSLEYWSSFVIYCVKCSRLLALVAFFWQQNKNNLVRLFMEHCFCCATLLLC